MYYNTDERPLSLKIFELVSAAATRKGVDAYVIGGYVRDFYLHRRNTDIDIVVIGSGIDLAREVGNELGTNVTVFKRFGTAMLHADGMEIEFVGARKESYSPDSRKPAVEEGTLEDDQLRRDFTINAMAWSLNSETYGELLDPFGGMEDMEERIIRTPCNPDVTFSDDPLRMIRGIRFAAQLGFDLHPDTFDAIVRNRERISIVSKERIVTELNKIMLAPMPSIGFELLDMTGLLMLIFPELGAMKGIDKVNGKGHKDNFTHTLKVLDNLARSSDDLWLRWAALLHDIGKPATKAYDALNGWTFHGHEIIGAKMVPRIFRALKLPMNDRMKYVQKLVSLHMRPIVLSQEIVTDSAVRRLLFEAGNDIDDLMKLCEADITSGDEIKVRRYLRNFRLVREKLRDIEEKDRVRNFQPPISGDLIMETYGLEPCSLVGEIKAVIKDAILDGKIENDYGQAYDLMEKLAAENGLVKKK